jgi:hypothetical protein
MKFVYSAVNAVASGKLDRETEERVSQAIEAELLVIATHLPVTAPTSSRASRQVGT